MNSETNERAHMLLFRGIYWTPYTGGWGAYSAVDGYLEVFLSSHDNVDDSVYGVVGAALHSTRREPDHPRLDQFLMERGG